MLEALGEIKSDFVIVAESSTDPSLKLLWKTLQKLGVEPINTRRIYLGTPMNPTIDQVKDTLEDLATELGRAGKHVLCIGSVAKQAVTGSKEGITKVQGTLLSPRKDLEAACVDKTIMAVMHPTYVLRADTPVANATFLAVVGAYVAQVKAVVTETVTPWGDHTESLAPYDRGAIDIEATPFPWWHEDHQLISAAFCFDGKTAYTVRLDEPEGLVVLKWLSNLPIKWVMHNGKYDRQALLHAGIDFNLVFDTMTAQYLIDPDQKKGLEFLSAVYLGLPPYKDVDYRKILSEPPDKIAQMNGIDAIRTFRLYSEVMKPKIVADDRLNRLFQFLMMPAVNALLELELGGIPMDMFRLGKLTGEYYLAHQRQLERLRAFAEDPDFNPNSTPQVTALFFDKLELPVLRRTPAGAPSFDAESRAQLVLLNPGVEYFNEYKQAYQGLKMFLEPWAIMQRDSKLHTSYKPSHVVTGRLSSEKPNFQQVPRDVRFRQLFGGVPGYQIIELDYSQIELRMAAWQAGEPTMLAAYDEDADLHTLTAELILGDPKARQVGKTLNFGLLYGAGPKKLREVAFNDYGVRLSFDEADRYHARFFATYPELRNFHNHIKNLARRQGYIDSPIGRRRYFQHISGFDRTRAAADERAAVNHPIQSMASDLMLYSLARLHRELGEKARVLATIHDSVLLLAPDEYVTEAAATAKDVMEIGVVEDFRAKWGVNIDVPLKVDWTAAPYWKEGV